MNRVKSSISWKKRLAASLLSFSVLLAAPAGVFPQGGQGHVSAAAAQDQDLGLKMAGMSDVQQNDMTQHGEKKGLPTATTTSLCPSSASTEPSSA